MRQDAPDALPDATPAHPCIRRTRLWLLIGFALTLGLLAALFSTTNLLPPFDSWFRVAALLLVLSATWAVFAGGFRPLFRRLSTAQAARRCVVLSAASTGACALAGVLLADQLPTTLARVFQPFADIPPASSVAYEVSPGNADVLRGEEPLEVNVRVTRGEPEQLTLELRGDDGRVLREPLVHDRSEPELWKTSIAGSSIGDGFAHRFRYRVLGGGTWSREYIVHLVERPVITGVQTVLHYPASLALPPRPNPAQTTEVTGPKGGQIEVIVQAEGEVAEGEIQFVHPVRRLIPPAE
jgi:hypothetical protein